MGHVCGCGSDGNGASAEISDGIAVSRFQIFKKRSVFHSLGIKIRKEPDWQPGVHIDNGNSVSQEKPFQEENFFIRSELEEIRGQTV